MSIQSLSIRLSIQSRTKRNMLAKELHRVLLELVDSHQTGVHGGTVVPEFQGIGFRGMGNR
jgi:hypothetical protein